MPGMLKSTECLQDSQTLQVGSLIASSLRQTGFLDVTNTTKITQSQTREGRRQQQQQQQLYQQEQHDVQQTIRRAANKYLNNCVNSINDAATETKFKPSFWS